MPRRAAIITQADIARAIRAADQCDPPLAEYIRTDLARQSVNPLPWRQIGSNMHTATVLGLVYYVEAKGPMGGPHTYSSGWRGRKLYRGPSLDDAKAAAQADFAAAIMALLT